MSTVHEILCKLSLEGDHSTPPSAYGSVKAYPNFDADRDALNIETAIKTKEVNVLPFGLMLMEHPSLGLPHPPNPGNSGAVTSPHSLPLLDFLSTLGPD